MIFVLNGSKKRTLESLNNENNNEKGELGKTIDIHIQRPIINNTFKVNMLERIQPSTNCSNCGK